MSVNAELTPGDVVSAFDDLLPATVRSAPSLAPVRHYLGVLAPDVANYHYYLEWNLRGGTPDPTFTFPTSVMGFVPLRFSDLGAHVINPLAGSTERGRNMWHDTCDAVSKIEFGTPRYPRALSISIESMTDGHAHSDVGFVFLDYGPVLDLATDPSHLAASFACFGTSARSDEALARLSEVAQGFELSHTGFGWRGDRPRHKVYLRGPIQPLLARVIDTDGGRLVRGCEESLSALARAVDERLTHLVVDVVDGEVTRVGFELNFTESQPADYRSIVLESDLYRSGVQEELRQEVETVVRDSPIERTLSDGSVGIFEASHLKVSFDGSGHPEWKTYLCFQRNIR